MSKGQIEIKTIIEHTSPTDVANNLTILSCGTATTLTPFISMMRWPTRTPPRSAIPPRNKLHICQQNVINTAASRRQLNSQVTVAQLISQQNPTNKCNQSSCF
jgi:hypothetical protein